ncbi:MAG: DNA polymerase III subunit delta, partial [Actinobacteria bacterium]|nr:DNA polymerase III subunit delta [Actinomycetota bacterium]
MSAPVYLLSGEPFLADEALAKLRDEVGSDPLSDVTFDSDVEVAELMGALQTPSLLGGSRLVVVHGAESLVKEQAEAISAYVEAPSSSAVLALVASAKTKVDAAVKKHGAVIALEAPKGRRLAGWIRDRARGHRLTVDDKAAWALIDSVGGDLRDLDGALSQLATAHGPGARIGAADVRRAFPRLADERIYAFTDAVGERRIAPAMTALRRLLEQGDEPLVLFGSLVAHVRRMLRVRPYVDQGVRAVADVAGMPEWRAERLAKQARTYKEEELVDALSLLAATDVEMKGDFPSPEAALERAVIQIVGGV